MINLKAFGWMTLVAVSLWAFGAQNPGDTLERGSQNPPDSARPRAWCHWMNGNIAREGIKADDEWMKRVGIGGFQNFDAALATPQIAGKRLVNMTPEWKDAFRCAATLADQPGLEMAIAGSPGWSETSVDGGRPFSGALAKPPSTSGPFQNIPRAGATAQYYADAAVIAYRVPDSEKALKELHPIVTASDSTSFDLASLTDGDLVKSSALKMAPAGQKAWIQFAFPTPQSIRGVTLVLQGVPRRAPSVQELECSNDGKKFRTVIPIQTGKSPETTISFAEVTAKFFRLTFKTLPPAAWFKTGARMWLDLGDVKPRRGIRQREAHRHSLEAAVPDRCDIRVEGWQPGSSRKYTYTTQQFYQEDSPLLPSGLLGPVGILRMESE